MVEFWKGVKELQQQVLDGELTGWKREQQLAGNGLQMTQSLETIQVRGCVSPGTSVVDPEPHGSASFW
jgi:hypothetical protein